MRDNLADLMAHNVSTAQKCYKLQEKSMASVEASKQLRDVMHGVSPVAEISEQESNSITEECTSVVSKHFWTAEKGSQVKTLFGEANKVITSEVVKEKICNHPELKGDNPKKEESAQQRIEILVDGVETSSDMIPPTMSSSVRNVLSGSELDNIRAVFKDMIVHSAPTSKPKVKSILEGKDWGKDLLKRLTLDTIVNGIKYERRL
ncbi:uncharacterized protein LOC141882322 [Acropora palmata]|uniref:uncharacterized protein LOC141882322 n=1 Tax=Acropora palmata TaxID=6131 RepID=UPI003DA107AB